MQQFCNVYLCKCISGTLQLEWCVDYFYFVIANGWRTLIRTSMTNSMTQHAIRILCHKMPVRRKMRTTLVYMQPNTLVQCTQPFACIPAVIAAVIGVVRTRSYAPFVFPKHFTPYMHLSKCFNKCSWLSSCVRKTYSYTCIISALLFIAKLKWDFFFFFIRVMFTLYFYKVMQKYENTFFLRRYQCTTNEGPFQAVINSMVIWSWYCIIQ